jgi:hypothetical protein
MAVKFKCLWGNGIIVTDVESWNPAVIVQRPWGYEVRADFLDGTRILNEVFVYVFSPTKAKIKDDVIAKIAQLELQINPPPPPTKNVTCQDGYVMTVLESDCPVNVDLTITVTTAQRNAWEIVRPFLKTYLIRIMRVYWILPPEKQQEMRSHCQLLDQVMDMVVG